MTTDTLTDCLLAGYDPARRGDLEARFAIATAETSAAFEIAQAGFRVLDPDAPVDVTIYCRDTALAIALFTGRGNPVEAFMSGDFSASGYLVWIFRILGAFRPV